MISLSHFKILFQMLFLVRVTSTEYNWVTLAEGRHARCGSGLNRLKRAVPLPLRVPASLSGDETKRDTHVERPLLRVSKGSPLGRFSARARDEFDAGV